MIIVAISAMVAHFAFSDNRTPQTYVQAAVIAVALYCVLVILGVIEGGFWV